MKRKRFIAFWDVLIVSIISAFLLPVALYIFIVLDGDAPWYLVIISATCFSISVTSMLVVQRVTIDLNCDKVEWFYLINLRKNDKDLNSNWNIYPSEIAKITVVRLTRQEKREYTSARFLFSKYLEIEMKYGHKKYVYISHYSKKQILKITELLLSHKTRQ